MKNVCTYQHPFQLSIQVLGLDLILSDQIARSAPLAVSHLDIRASDQKEPHRPRGFNRVHRLDS